MTTRSGDVREPFASESSTSVSGYYDNADMGSDARAGERSGGGKNGCGGCGAPEDA